MNYKDPQIEITQEQPFANCKLGREQYADALESIVSTTPDGCVIALNGEWGTGKTTFVKMWKQKLENNGFKTVYFNAWETDFVSDPLVALIGELGRIVKEGDKNKNLKKVKEILVSRFLFRSLPKFASGALRLAGFENVTDGGQEIIDGIKLLFEKELGDYEIECKEFDELRKSLSALVGDIDPQKPLVFFIDELDRCNPHYAVRLLERVKHLFSLSRIVFVLCIDKEQLCHSICGYYGSENINAPEYLRRFIDVDYYLPEPDYDMFFDFMYSELDFDQLVFRGKGTEVQHLDKGGFSVAKLLFESHKLSLRQIEKTLTHIRLTAQTISNMGELNLSLLVVLVYLRQFLPEIYRKIRAHEYDIKTLASDIEKFMPKLAFRKGNQRKRNAVRELNYAIADLLLVYYNDAEYSNDKEKIYEGTNRGDMKLLFETTLIDRDAIITEFDIYGNYPHRTQNVLQNTIKHIELMYELRPGILGE